MKWSIVGLVLLGLLAAASAAFLVASMQAGKQPGAATPEASRPPEEAPVPDVDVLVASRDLEPMTLLGAEDIEVQRVPRTSLPQGAHSSKLQVIGKLVVLPVRQGQALTASLFAADGSGHLLAAALAEGKRAVSVSLSDRMGLEGLLYPGCTVDVLASMTVNGGPLGDEKVSATILEAVTVLAVGERTIVEPEGQERSSGGRSASTRQSVALVVTPRQAEALQLAMQEGSVSLVMRNPTDLGTSAGAATRLPALNPTFADRERLILENHRLAAERDEAERQKRELEAAWNHERAERAIERDRATAALDEDRHFMERFELEQRKAELITPRRPVMILRGGEAESTIFEVPAQPEQTASASSIR